jgi:hypothetical protein
MRRVRRKLWNIKHREPHIRGSLHRPRDFLLLLRVPCRLPHIQGEDTAGFKFYPVLKRLDLNDPGMQQRFHDQAAN